MRNIVAIKEVFKTIDKEEILSGINLQIAEGEIYGFIKNGEIVEQVSMKEIRRENIDLEEYFISHFLNDIKDYEVD